MATGATVGRPSRRDAVVRSAMELFATGSLDEITVADIAARAKMTAAAVYYHFDSKDSVLLSGFRRFGEALVARFTAETSSAADDGLGALIARVLRWLDECDPDATVYFLSSVGITLEVERARRTFRHDIMRVLAEDLRRRTPSRSEPDCLVISASVLGTFETAAGSWIERDDTYRGLGRRSFLDEVVDIVDRIVDTPI